jgi:hypothetical protein
MVLSWVQGTGLNVLCLSLCLCLFFASSMLLSWASGPHLHEPR